MLKARVSAFFKQEAAPGILLIAAACLALIFANSPLVQLYQWLLSVSAQIRVGSLNVEKPLLLWVNDGLMAIFFLGVGLEIKREFIKGHLAKLSQVVLPGVAAIGGIAIPALIYTAFTYDNPEQLKGWAIPSATDIAFSLGILALLGSRIPVALKIFVMTLAVLDDLGAVIIIALFYTSDLSTRSLALAALFTAILFILNRAKVRNTAIYLIVGVALWTSVLKSGVHATLAGIILAMAIPLDSREDQNDSPAEHLMHALHPWIGFAIVPIFAFANAGVSFLGITLENALHPITLGIALGLLLGKPIGIFGFSWLLIKLRLAELPQGTSWTQLLGAAVICGIGFTMSLFISSLAFSHSGATVMLVDRLGILVGSLLAAILGYWILARARPPLPNTVGRP